MAATPSMRTARPSARSANGFLPISWTTLCGSPVTPREESAFDLDEVAAAVANRPSTGGWSVKPGKVDEDAAVDPQTLRCLAVTTAEGEMPAALKIAIVTRSSRPPLVRSPI